jgi:hypothetical protein
MEFNFFESLAFYIPLLPAVMALAKWGNLNNYQRLFAILLWCIVMISFSGDWYRKLDGINNNMPFFHIYILVEYLLLLQIFRFMYGKDISLRTWWGLSIGFILTWIVNTIIGEGWWGFPDYIHALEAIVIIILVIRWFLKMLREKSIAQPSKTFEFWLCAGLLIFFTGNFLLFLFPKFLINTGKEVFEAIWQMNCILIIITYLLYTVAILWAKKTVK